MMCTKLCCHSVLSLIRRTWSRLNAGCSMDRKIQQVLSLKSGWNKKMIIYNDYLLNTLRVKRLSISSNSNVWSIALYVENTLPSQPLLGDLCSSRLPVITSSLFLATQSSVTESDMTVSHPLLWLQLKLSTETPPLVRSWHVVKLT